MKHILYLNVVKFEKAVTFIIKNFFNKNMI
jgi:hypothetical protein